MSPFIDSRWPCRRSAGGVPRFLCVLTAGSLLFGCSEQCAAQPRVATGGTVGFSSQRHGDSDPRLAPSLEGDSWAGLLFIDRIVGSRVSVGGEMTLGGEIKGRQQQRSIDGIIDFRSRHHDTIVSGITKVKMFTFLPLGHRPDARAELAAVAGAGLAWRHTVRGGTLRRLQPPPLTADVEQQLSNVVVAGTIGFDAVFVFSPRTALVSMGRYQLLNDDDRDAVGLVRRGVASTVFRFCMGTRFAF